MVAGNGQQTVTLVQQSSTLPQLGPDVSPLTLTQESVRPDIMRVKIGAPGRWEVPRATFPANISAAGETAGLVTCSSVQAGGLHAMHTCTV